MRNPRPVVPLPAPSVGAAPGRTPCCWCGRPTSEPIVFCRRRTPLGIIWTWHTCAACAPDCLSPDQAWRLVMEHAVSCPTCRLNRECRTLRTLLGLHRAAIGRHHAERPAAPGDALGARGARGRPWA